MLAGRDPQRLERAAREVGTLSTAAFDATNFDQLKKFFNGLPTPIDHVLVTGPGPYYAPLADLDVEKARQRCRSPPPAAVAGRSLTPQSKVRAGGTLLFMGGTGGRRTATGMRAHRGSDRRDAGHDEEPRRSSWRPIRVNLIAPGFVDTPLSASLLGDQLDARREQLRKTLPIRRVVGPADIAALAVHLMTNTALTGGTYDIDGGQQLVEG